jgi:hypothetical protein
MISPGADYGWPMVEGFGGTRRGFTDPLRAWHTEVSSPSGVARAFAGRAEKVLK